MKDKFRRRGRIGKPGGSNGKEEDKGKQETVKEMRKYCREGKDNLEREG